ncbi:MAG TPA: hypothetical protein VKI44_31160 [Acetobacteraceae bacterium]|nr:hypothetical protein [Acetobacteraceae bacterium]
MTDQRSEPPMKSETIILKELDHIQAIMARFDTFSFIMKQVCLAAISALLLISASSKFRLFPLFIWLVPLVFFMLEVHFRFAYWGRYVDRVDTMKKYLQGTFSSIELYVIVKPQRDYSYWDKTRWCSAVKPFDVHYYGTWVILTLIVAGVYLEATVLGNCFPEA